MENILKLYTISNDSANLLYDDESPVLFDSSAGIRLLDQFQAVPFPSESGQIEIYDFKYDAKRMGGAPTISATIMYERCLDKEWNPLVFTIFNGERYFIKQIPSSQYSNEDARYKHEIELVSERIVLDNVYFYDVVAKDVVNDKPVSNNSKFTFFGDIHEFASRLNYSLQYSKMDYTVVVDDGISSEGKFVSFEDTFFSNAIQESYNTYEIPYYFDGKTIHFGFTNNAITQTFKYGVDESLLSIQKQNANYKVVNRVTGIGSSDNIPYYYPNLNEWGIINVQVGWDKANAGYDWDFSQENELELKASDVVIVDEEKFATNLSPDDRVICYGYKWYRNILNGEEIFLDDIGVKIINHDGNQGCPNAYFWFGQKRMGYAMPVQSNLMPPIYRSTEGEERFYNALNNTYTSPETGTFYEFENQYADGKQKEQIVNFEDIKPSIVGMTNANGQRIDTFLEFAYDENDNDEIDEEGNYLHPYFFAKLPKYDGAYGFNLFDHALNEEEMTISMTSGSCGACEWTVMVDSETLKNTVQVDSDGNLLRDKNGNVSFGAAQDKQNDTINNEVWVALKKDIDTFGVVMPNVTNNYKPSAGDTFVILHILLPNAYIFAAENRLKEELIKYMAANNSEKFNFSIAFSRIYFAENPDVLGKLNENARIQIEYNGELHELYVSSFAYSMDSNSPLPNITVELSDTLAVQQNALQTAISQVEHSIMKNIGSIDWLKLGLAYFLRKDTDDRSRGKVASDKGFEVGKFVSGTSGAMIYLDKTTNKTVAELDKIYVRVKAYFEQLEIVNVNSIGGKQIISPAGSIRCKAVEAKDDIDYYRCYILAEQDGDKIENRFKVGDQAYCQMFNAKEGVENNISNRYYWRLVVGVGEDYIDLSKSDCDTNSDAPMANDIICQRGNREDIDRQNFMEFSSVDSFSPSITLYQKVDSYSLVDKEVIQYGVDKTTGKGFMNIYGEMYVGDREQSSYMRYTQENGLEIRGKLVTKGGDDVENYLTSMQDYMDGLVETYYGGYTPTNNNYPSIEWSTEEEKKQHINDVFINTEEFKDEETTPNAGLTWRWSCDENGIYGWQVIADKDIANSYKNAVLANKDAIAAKNSSDEVAKAGNEIKVITDSAFADDTVTESEKSQIDSKIVIITNLLSSLQSTYLELKNNALLAGIEKTNLTNGYSSLVSAINELTSSITSVMADNNITDVERALISGKFEAFYSKQGDYNKYVLSALKAIQGTINAVSIRALDELGGYAYLKKALKESTVIKNGLVQSSVVALGYTDAEGQYHIMAGTNGLVDDVLTDKTPAIWAGGGMIDKEASEENASNPDAADFLVRMDGSGYAAGGKLSWDITGKVKADPLSFFVGENIVGALLASFQVVLKADKEHPDYVIPQVPFQKLQIADYIEIGDAWLKYDSTNNAVYVVHKDGSDKTINFYAEGGVSAKGFSDSTGGGGGSTTLYGLNDVLKNATEDGVYGAAVGKVLMYNGTHWYAGDAKGKVVSIKVGETNYAPDDDGLISLPEYAKVVNKTITADKFIGALQGNADTATKLKNTLTIQKNAVSMGAFDGSEAKVINIEVPTKVSELTNDSKYLVASNLIQGTNISIATDASTGNVTISNTYSYTHPTNGANTTIAAASGRVLSEITVNNLGHVTAVGYKTLAAADIPTLSISKISGLQSALDSKLNASVFNDLFEKVMLSDGVTYAIRAKYGFYSDSFVSAKGSNSESGGSGGGGVGSIYVGSTQYNSDSEGIVRLPAYPTVPTSLKNPYVLTIQANGTSLDTYDGSAAKTVNITYANVGAAAASHTHTIAQVTELQSSLDDKYSSSASRTANTVLAAPNGSSGTATFRKLVAEDLPSTVRNFTDFDITYQDYSYFVVGLFCISDTYTGGVGTSQGTVYITRNAGTHWVINAEYAISNAYSSTTASTTNQKVKFMLRELCIDSSFKPCTFLYDSKKYAGLVWTGFSSPHKMRVMKAYAQCTPFFVRYYNTSSSSVLNSEIYNSIRIDDTDITYNSEHLFGNLKLFHGNVTANTFVGSLQGNSDTATALTTSAGSYNSPVYLSDGKPVACTLDSTMNNMINSLSTGTATPHDNDYYVCQYAGGGTTTTTYHRRPISALYTYIKNKAEGTWGISITGNAATATKLATSRTLWGQNFDGTSNVSGAMTGVTSITIGDCVITYDSANKGLKFSTGIYSEQYVSAKGANSESGGSGGGIGSIYVGSKQYKVESDGTVRLPSYPAVPTSLKNPYALTIQKNGITQGVYDGSTEKSVNITVPTKVSELTNDSNFLTNHQAIYSLTIQGNGTTIGTYTPNSEAKSINITAAGIGAAAATHKQAYTADACTTYTTDNENMGVTPAAVKKAIGLFEPKAHTHNVLGAVTAGSSSNPVYFNAGVPTAVDKTATFNALVNSITVGSATPKDEDYYISQYSGGGTTTTTYHRRPHSALYAYLKGKAEGTWGINISGNSSTSTKLQTARTLWGQSFDGTANVGGTITGTNFKINDTSSNPYLMLGTSWCVQLYQSMIQIGYSVYNSIKVDSSGNLILPTSNRKIYFNGSTSDDQCIYYSNTYSRICVGFNEAKGFNVGSLLVSGAWSDSTLVPTNGIYSKGNIYSAGAITAKASSSDIRLKTDISNYDALSIIRKYRSVKYHWNMVAKKNSVIFDDEYWHYGLIAQELQKDLPHFVKDVFNDYLTIEYERLTPIMWRGIQEVDDEVTKLKKKIMKLEMEINELKQERR